MATVKFRINSKNYSVDCKQGQESQILEIANQMDLKAREIAGAFGELDSETLLLMVCILTFGDMNKLKHNQSTLEQELLLLRQGSVDEDAIASFISQLSSRVQSMSNALRVAVYDDGTK